MSESRLRTCANILMIVMFVLVTGSYAVSRQTLAAREWFLVIACACLAAIGIAELLRARRPRE